MKSKISIFFYGITKGEDTMQWQNITEPCEDGVYACRNLGQHEFGVFYKHNQKWCLCLNKTEYVPLPPLNNEDELEILRIDTIQNKAVHSEYYVECQKCGRTSSWGAKTPADAEISSRLEDGYSNDDKKIGYICQPCSIRT